MHIYIHPWQIIYTSARAPQMMGNSIKGVHIPFPPLARQPVKFRFVTPASVDLVGSFLLRTVTKPVMNVDVAVEMPQVGLRMHGTGGCRLGFEGGRLMKHDNYASRLLEFS